MKDKILPPDYNQSSLEDLTDRINKIIEDLENEKDLNNSIESYQELLRLNNMIEKKFTKNFKSINENTYKRIKKLLIKMKNELNKIANDTNLFLKNFIKIKKFTFGYCNEVRFISRRKKNKIKNFN